MTSRNRPGQNARVGTPTPPGWTNRSAARPMPASLPKDGQIIIRRALFAMDPKTRQTRGAIALMVFIFAAPTLANLIDRALP